MTVPMVVVPEPPATARAVLGRAPSSTPTPVYTGLGQVDLVCGECASVVAHGLREAEQLAHLVLVCGNCQSYNTSAS
jgi:hypothetical protein